MIDSYREISTDFQEDWRDLIISIVWRGHIIAGIRDKSKNPGADNGKKYPNDKERLKNI